MSSCHAEMPQDETSSSPYVVVSSVPFLSAQRARTKIVSPAKNRSADSRPPPGVVHQGRDKKE